MDPAAIGFVDTHTPQHIILIRIGIAALLGGAIGYERAARNVAAGVRTHVLIATAAALFTVLAFEIYRQALDGGSQNPDPIRSVEAVTAGIAFLGAGAIFQQRGSIQGLTTASGMWLAGAVGIAAALGFYGIAFVVALFAVLVLAALRAFAHRVAGDEGEKRDAEVRGRPGT